MGRGRGRGDVTRVAFSGRVRAMQGRRVSECTYTGCSCPVEVTKAAVCAAQPTWAGLSHFQCKTVGTATHKGCQRPDPRVQHIAGTFRPSTPLNTQPQPYLNANQELNAKPTSCRNCGSSGSLSIWLMRPLARYSTSRPPPPQASVWFLQEGDREEGGGNSAQRSAQIPQKTKPLWRLPGDMRLLGRNKAIATAERMA